MIKTNNIFLFTIFFTGEEIVINFENFFSCRNDNKKQTFFLGAEIVIHSGFFKAAEIVKKHIFCMCRNGDKFVFFFPQEWVNENQMSNTTTIITTI